MIYRVCVTAILLMVPAFLLTGCAPPEAEKVAKPRTSQEATGRWTSVRGSRGQSYKSEHTIDGESFEAGWEITRVIGGYIQLQLKLPSEWDSAKVYNAVELVFEQEEDQPWYYPIEDSILPMVRRGLFEAKDEKDPVTAIDSTPEMPYALSTKIHRRGSEWFINIRATLIPDSDSSF